MKALSVKSNAKVNSRQTCDGGDINESCRENTANSLGKNEAQREGVGCEKQCEEKLKRTCGGGVAKVSGSRNAAISLDKKKGAE